jgi:8-oxo-dGTP pyrophosphatase MutT (NUDIX family)
MHDPTVPPIAEHPVVLHLTRRLAERHATQQGERYKEEPRDAHMDLHAPAVSPEDPRRTEYRMAAVALVLRLGPAGAPELLFIARAPYEGDPWSAQVAFPGGRAEPVDASLEETAIRETLEETGLDLRRDGRILGVLDDVTPSTVRLPAIVVRPFVAIAGHGVAAPHSAEIGATFWVPLSVLQAEGVWRDVSVVAQGVTLRVPAIQYEEYVIWGLTARILRQLLACAAG